MHTPRKSKIDSSSDRITEGIIWKQLLIFFFPIVLGTFFQQLYNTVDTIIVGRFVGKEALASVGGSAGQLSNLVIGFFTGLSSGAAVVLSQFWGAKNEKSVKESVHTAYAFSIAASLVITLSGIISAPALLRWMNTPEELMTGSLIYLRIYYGGILFSFIFNTGSSILRASGDSRRPLYYLAVCCLINIVLDVVLVLAFDLGIAGVSIATVAAQAVSAGLVTRTLMKEKGGLHLELGRIHFSRRMLKSQLYIGIPAGIQTTMYNISNIIIQAALNRFGTDTMAAWAAYGKLDAIYWMISGAFGIAITTFVGQNYGAGKYKRLKKSVWVCMGMESVIAVGLIAFLFFLRTPLFGIFTTDADVVKIGSQMLQMIAPFYLVYVIVEISSGALRGIGDVVIPTIIILCSICILRSVWIMIAMPIWPVLTTILVSYPATWLLSSILFFIYYNWRIRNLPS